MTGKFEVPVPEGTMIIVHPEDEYGYIGVAMHKQCYIMFPVEHSHENYNSLKSHLHITWHNDKLPDGFVKNNTTVIGCDASWFSNLNSFMMRMQILTAIRHLKLCQNIHIPMLTRDEALYNNSEFKQKLLAMFPSQIVPIGILKIVYSQDGYTGIITNRQCYVTLPIERSHDKYEFLCALGWDGITWQDNKLPDNGFMKENTTVIGWYYPHPYTNPTLHTMTEDILSAIQALKLH